LTPYRRTLHAAEDVTVTEALIGGARERRVVRILSSMLKPQNHRYAS
jgi:hypothetical protein